MDFSLILDRSGCISEVVRKESGLQIWDLVTIISAFYKCYQPTKWNFLTGTKITKKMCLTYLALRKGFMDIWLAMHCTASTLMSN